MKSVVRVLLLLACMLALAAGVVFLSRITDGFSSNPRTTYLTYGTNLYATDSDFKVTSENTTLNVVSLSEETSFTVKIVADTSKDFTYTVDGEEYSFKTEFTDIDLSKKFSLTDRGNAITFTFPYSSMTDFLQDYHNNTNVKISSSINFTSESYFILECYQADDDYTIKLSLIYSIDSIEEK